jgi:uncharacterized membrane protein
MIVIFSVSTKSHVFLFLIFVLFMQELKKFSNQGGVYCLKTLQWDSDNRLPFTCIVGMNKFRIVFKMISCLKLTHRQCCLFMTQMFVQ